LNEATETELELTKLRFLIVLLCCFVLTVYIILHIQLCLCAVLVVYCQLPAETDSIYRYRSG